MGCMRTINKELLKEQIRRIGKERLAVEAKCSAAHLDKLMSDGYTAAPRQLLRESICAAIGISEDELFPEQDDQSELEAS